MKQSPVRDLPPGAGRGHRLRPVTSFTLYSAFSSAQVSRGIFILYMLAHGLSLFKVGLVESCFQLARMVTEVPFGILADRWQRRGTIQLGIAMHVLAAMIFVIADNLFVFMLIFALLGAGWGAQSGADAALLYDHLNDTGQEPEFAKIDGRATAAGYLTLAVATASGGPLASIYGKLPFIAEAVLIASSLFFIGLVPESAVHLKEAVDHSYWRTLGQAVRTVSRKRILQTFIIFTALLEAGTAIISILSQGLLHTRGFTITQTTLALGFVTALSAGASVVSYRLVKRGPGISLAISACLYIAGLAIMLVPGRGSTVLGFYMVFLNLDLLLPALNQFFNRLVAPDVRATALSVQTFCFSGMALLGFPLATAAAGAHGYDALIAGVLGFSLPVLIFTALMYARTGNAARSAA